MLIVRITELRMNNNGRHNGLAKIVLLLACLLIIMPGSVIASEKTKLPDWVVDTINLPLPENAKLLDTDVHKDTRGRYIITYEYVYNGDLVQKGMDVFTHGIENIYTGPGSKWGNVACCCKVPMTIKTDNIDAKFYTIKWYNTRKVKCKHPLSDYTIITNENDNLVYNYMLIFSSSKKYLFHINESCWGMDRMSTVEINNMGVDPFIWQVRSDRILISYHDIPSFILIDLNGFDKALKENKTMVFNKGGVKGYWVKKEIVDQWINEAHSEYDGKKGKKPFYQYIDEMITMKLAR